MRQKGLRTTGIDRENSSFAFGIRNNKLRFSKRGLLHEYLRKLLVQEIFN